LASISVDQETKAAFDERKPDDLTHDEFVQELLAAHKRDNGEVVDVQELVDSVNKQTAASVELAAYRGVSQAIEDKA